ncbi:hypothetical protein CEXT_633021 [Caerostris extrusa]|uniref:Uncharacterized protein n=1 Tax=Caerostris extrusa TaxID=172846 RepID=A0AAV4MYN3_CAEEX|nr:hypothetical protein CEXT_633021 [Caerostris extrusa]
MRSLEFPAVTICSLNRMMDSYKTCLNPNVTLERCLQPVMTTNNGKPRTTLVISERRSLQSCTSALSGKLNNEKDHATRFLMKYLAVSMETRQAIGYQSKDFIKSCSFNWRSCSEEDFEEFQNLHYGNCFTFNKVNGNKTKAYTTSQTGHWSGLVLTLDLKYYEYMTDSATIGARVIIHDPKESPSPEETGINISPGFETSVALMKTFETRLPYPFRDQCANYGNIEIWPYYESQSQCIRECIQGTNYKVCGCADPSLTSTTSQKSCNLTDVLKMCCLENVLNLFLLNKIQLATALCLAILHIMEKRSRLPNGHLKKHSTKDDYQLKHMRQNQAKLKVFFSSMVQKTYEQHARFHQPELFSHLGGELGLWLGISLMVIFELLENGWYLMKGLVKRLKLNHRQ